MLLFALLIALTPADLTGFWHAEQDLSGGYEGSYFFWETGEYAHLESIHEGVVYTGTWVLDGDELVLSRTDAMELDGTQVNTTLEDRTLSISMIEGKGSRVFLDGESFFHLSDDPDNAIISLMPTYGMSASERDAFSTYD